ncbi:hypothetical protein BDZ45DRAFT_784177 [Acephala macrosclerotiorum]|nr:hypothetical protein BDZ45DRAFT_784177 [Acephala macrosclerotiorum]
MQFSTLFIAAFPLLALAAPTPSTIAYRQTQADIATAMNDWLHDTFLVSSFLDYAVSFGLPNSPPNLESNAMAALTSEMDELSHKMVLDNYFLTNTDTPNQAVMAASQVLTTGNPGPFLQVVYGLMDMSVTGNLADVATINAIRCSVVLPAIDAYSLAVAQALGAAEVVPASRPAACGGL